MNTIRLVYGYHICIMYIKNYHKCLAKLTPIGNSFVFDSCGGTCITFDPRWDDFEVFTQGTHHVKGHR